MRYLALFLILIPLAACAERSSNSGGSPKVPQEVWEARNIIRAYYPEAATMPVVISDRVCGAKNWGCYNNGVIGLTTLWLEDSHKYWNTPCVLAHEWKHSIQTYTTYGSHWREVAENEARIVSTECEKLIR